MKIAYAIQNVGGIDFKADVGDTVPVKQSLLGLHRAGQDVSILKLHRRIVIQMDLPDLVEHTVVSSGFTEGRLFVSLERAGRRLGRDLRLNYYAAVDSLRFYSACMRVLPEFDLCHEHNGLFSIGAALACRRLRLPYVLTFSADLLLERELVGQALTGLHRRIAHSQASFTYRTANAILCVSQSSKNHLVENWNVPADKIYVMPNGVDTELFSPDAVSEPGLKAKYGLEGSRIVTFVGGFQPWHGLDKLVESFASVLQEVPDTKLLLVGDGRARPIVDKAVEKYGISNNVVITGLVPQTRIPEFLSISDLAVMPYPELPMEMWFSPLKMYEYMAAGKPVIASRSGQIAEVIKDGYNGVLIKPGDVQALTGAIIDLLKNTELRQRLGDNARKQAVAQHSWTGYVERLESVYRKVISERAAGLP